MKQFRFSSETAYSLGLHRFYKYMLMGFIPIFIFVFNMFICYYV